MNEEDMLRIVEMTQQQLRREERQTTLLADGPIANLIRDALSAVSKPELNWIGNARSPALPQNLDEAEKRIEDHIPEQVREFYLESDGFEALSDEFPYPFWQSQRICLGKALNPPLTEWVRLHQVADPYREEGAPLPLFPHNDLGALAADDPPISLEQNDIDALVVMEDSEDFRRICFSTKPLEQYEPGAIVVIERCIATIYPNIKSWLAAVAVMFAQE